MFSLMVLVRRWRVTLRYLHEPQDSASVPIDRILGFRKHIEDYVSELSKTYQEIEKSNNFDTRTICKLMREDSLMKRELIDCGFEWLITGWRILESKLSKDLKSYSRKRRRATFAGRSRSGSPKKSPIRSTSPIPKVRDCLSVNDGTDQWNIQRGIRRSGRLSAKRGISRLEPVKTEQIASDEEKNRFAVEKKVPVKRSWKHFAAEKDEKDITTNSCGSSRRLLELSPPKTFIDMRREAKLRKRVKLESVETAQPKKPRSQSLSFSKELSNSQNSATSGRENSENASLTPDIDDFRARKGRVGQKLNLLPSKRMRKQQQGQKNEITSPKKQPKKKAFVKHEVANDVLLEQRPKRQIKAPKRFVFDDEENEEETTSAKGRSHSLIKPAVASTNSRELGKSMEPKRRGRRRKSEKQDVPAVPAETPVMEAIVLIDDDDYSFDARRGSRSRRHDRL
ncbi:unnamed protein product, partial [Gongylonema pulchrum]